jgi:beta-N-acetylhexosaminidase
MTTSVELAVDLLGELFIMGFPGTELGLETAEFISQKKIGGVIYFKANYKNANQLKSLSEQVQACASEGLPLWISVDQEGGRVQRLKGDSFTLIPPAREQAKNRPEWVEGLSYKIATELTAVGINVDYTPVADINTNPANPIIGDRAFGTTVETTSPYVEAVVRGFLRAGVQPCIKHFPGHGDTDMDSHLALPKVQTDLATLREREFHPFTTGIEAGCQWIMTAHVLVPELDPRFPATLSTQILKTILREELGYQGLIISDDLEMKAITDHYGEDDSPRLALEAGCDLLIYRSEEATRKAYAALESHLRTGKLSPETVIAAAQRSKKIKRDTLQLS